MTIMRPPQQGHGGGSWSEEVEVAPSLLVRSAGGGGTLSTCRQSVELLGAVAVGEQAIVADAMETVGEDVEQEAAHELAGVEAHDLAAGDGHSRDSPSSGS